MKIYDSHAHIYPHKIAEKATQAIGVFYDIKMEMPAGTSESLIEAGSKAGISGYVVHSCATKASQVKAINEFIKDECDKHNEFYGFMTLHEDMTAQEVEEEVDRCVKKGFYGIKLHPDFQRFNIDGEEVLKFYEIVGDRLPFLFHTGDDRYDYSAPERLANVAKKYKQCKFIGAHFGGYRCWHRVDCYKGLDNVYFDTSSSLPFIDNELATSLINRFGAEKFLFGVDFPMWDATEELNRFLSLKLNDREKEIILGENLENLLNLKK